jgi:hypothetical protein
MWVGYERGSASEATLSFFHCLTLPQQSSATGTPIIQNNGFHDVTSELQVLQDQLQARDAKIVELEREAAVLRDDGAIGGKDLVSLGIDLIEFFVSLKRLHMINFYKIHP